MKKRLIFSAGNCELGLDVASVREVVPAATLSPALSSAETLEGLLNLRGSIVPVLSLPAALRIQQPPICESDFLIIIADSRGRRFAIRANGEVQFTDEAAVVTEDDAKQDADAHQHVQVGTRIATMLEPDRLSPHGDASSSAEMS